MFAVALALVFLLTTAEDWPTYLHDAQRTAASGETSLSTANAGQLAPLWKFATAGVVAASPTVVGGVVYVGSWDGYEYALDAATGAQKWKTYLGQTNDSTCNPPNLGVESTAAVVNGVVYVGGGDSNWYALDATTGSILWTVPTGDNSSTGGHFNWSSPLLYNGSAYIGIASNCDQPLVQGQVLKVDLVSHQVVATWNAVPNGQVGGGVWTSPSLDAATNTIYVTTGTQGVPLAQAATQQPYSLAIVALDAGTLTLKDHWQIPTSSANPDSDWGTTPILFAGSSGTPMVAAVNKNGFLYAFNRGNLAAGPLWSQPVAEGANACPQCGDGSVSSGAFGNGTLFQAGGNTTINGSTAPGSVRAFDTAGKVLWQHAAPDHVIAAIAYSNGLVIDGAGAYLEVLVASTGARAFSYRLAGSIYSPPSVSNGTVFVGSLDGNVYAFQPKAQPPPPPDPNCPAGWTCQDVGGATPSGSDSASGSSWTVRAGGSGLSGTSDQFRLVSTSLTGDLQITGQVSSVSSPSTSQAGVLVRQTTDPSSPFYGVFVNPAGQVTVEYRSSFGGAVTTGATLTSTALPLYIGTQRRGDTFVAGMSTDGVNFSLVPSSSATVIMPSSILAGAATSSGSNGAATSATYNSVATGPPSTWLDPTCPSTWSCADIGSPTPAGSQSLSSGTWTVSAGGSDIWGTSDQFRYVWQNVGGTGGVSADVASQTNSNAWAKAGVMLRQSSDPGSPFYDVVATPANGVVVQYRSTLGGYAATAASVSGAAPEFVEAFRSGGTFSAYTSTDGSTWNLVPGSSVVLSMPSTILGGLAVTSHNSTTVGTATFNTAQFPSSAPAPPACPTGWTCADVGNPVPAGTQSVSGGTWTVQGGGADIWGTSDQFHYISEPLSTDGGISAELTSQTNTSGWAKAGLMIRQSSAAGAAFYDVVATPSNGIVVQYRATAGASAVTKASLARSAPTYLEVYRAGGTYAAYWSLDGATWNLISGSAVALSFTNPVQVGMAVTSHNTAALGAATFTSVQIPTTGPKTCPTGWSCGDIGSPAPAGTQSLSSGVWTVTGGGSDIWNGSDQFHYVWKSQGSDSGISARMTAQTNTNAWAKAGLMIRQSTAANAPFYDLVLTPSNGLVVQYRSMAGGNAVWLATTSVTLPAYLEVFHSGTQYTAYTSADGVNWTLVPGSTVSVAMSLPVLVGMAVSSHNATTLGSATFDTVKLPSTAPGTPPPVCPTGWSCADIGSSKPAGSQSLSGSTWTVQGGGSDIWGTSDQFRYVSQSLPGDGSMSAHEVSETNTSGWAKAGLMMRLGTAANAPFYDLMVTPSNGVVVEYRASAGASALSLASSSGSAPAFLKIQRSGTTFTAYSSSDGVTWTPIGGSTVTLTGLSGSILVGFAVTSHNTAAICTATFDTVTRIG